MSGTSLASGTLLPIGTVTDSSVLRIIDGYRTVLALRYIAIEAAEITTRLHGEAFVSAKVDGELWFLWVVDGVATLVAPNGRQILDSPITAAVPAGLGDVVLAGELIADVPGRRARIADVARALSGSAEHALEFLAFDVVAAGDITSASSPYDDRWQWMARELPESGPLRAAPTVTVPGPADVLEAYEDYVAGQGYEGIVVRAADARTYKIKPVIDVDAVIIGFTERLGDFGAVKLRSILVGLEHPDGGIVPICSCGNLGSARNRQDLYDRLKPAEVDSDYRHSSATGVLYRFVRPEIVAEIRCHDIQGEDSRGSRIMSALLRFDADGWHGVGRVEAASIIHPVLERVRDDKSPTGPDVGWRHIEGFLPPADPDALGGDQPSEVVRREVWTKATAGRTDVRKLVVWKTNKEPAFGAYVVHWTDYSAARKEPLKREVRLAPTLTTAEKLAEDMIAANIKRGWVPVDNGT